MPDASPVKWHLAHTTWFFETFVLAEREGFVPFDPAFRVLFNSYYVAVGERHPRPERGLLSRPDLATVRAYRARVDAAMRALFASDIGTKTAARIELGLNHEQQHQNSSSPTSTCSRAIRRAGIGPDGPGAGAPASRRLDRLPGGLESFGHGADGFAPDNELPRHRVLLEPFALDRGR
jgi:hypothetical protein